MRDLGLMLIACSLLGVSAIGADPPVSALETALEAEWHAPVERFRDFVVSLAAGEMEAAWQQYRIMLIHPPKSTNTPFEPDPYERFVQQVKRFPKGMSSLQILGERRFTGNSRKFTLIADTEAGPVVLEVMIYRARGEWFFGNFGYQVVAAADTAWLRQFDDLLPATRYAQPFPLSLPERTDSSEAGGQ